MPLQDPHPFSSTASEAGRRKRLPSALRIDAYLATVVMAIVAGPLSNIELAQRRHAHVEMCCELLAPRAV